MPKQPYGPKFPDRPQHDDFWMLADAATSLDGLADGGVDLKDISRDEGVDDDSMIYMARQRALRAVRLMPEPKSETQRQAQVMATWIDGFMIALRFAQAKSLAEMVDGNRRRQEGQK